MYNTQLQGTTRYWKQDDGTPIIPTARQLQFLKHADTYEVLIAGSGNSGKTVALRLLMAQFAHRADWHVLCLRESYKALAGPGGLGYEAYRMFRQFPEAHVNESKGTITWDSGCTMEFGYLSSLADIDNYQGRPITCLILDECGQVPYEAIATLSTWVRHAGEGSNTPLMIRLASNTLGPYIEDYEARFIDRPGDRVLIEAHHEDLPFDTSDWVARQRATQDDETFSAYVEGKWRMKRGHRMLNIDRCEVVDKAPDDSERARAWDLGATVDGDYTAGVLMARSGIDYYLVDVELIRATAGNVQNRMREVAVDDGIGVPIGIETALASAGPHEFVGHTNNLAGYDVRSMSVRTGSSTGAKEARARALAAAIDNGHVKVTQRFVDNHEAMRQMRMFPTKGIHDDVPDAAAYAYQILAGVGTVDWSLMFAADDF